MSTTTSYILTYGKKHLGCHRADDFHDIQIALCQMNLHSFSCSLDNKLMQILCADVSMKHKKHHSYSRKLVWIIILVSFILFVLQCVYWNVKSWLLTPVQVEKVNFTTVGIHRRSSSLLSSVNCCANALSMEMRGCWIILFSLGIMMMTCLLRRPAKSSMKSAGFVGWEGRR